MAFKFNRFWAELIRCSLRLCPQTNMAAQKSFVTLGMFIIDEFSFSDDNGVPSGRTMLPQERLVLN
jgi:hypothetical protein